MNKRLLEIQARKAELLKELEGDVTEERLSEIEKEQATLETEERSIRSKSDLIGKLSEKTEEKPEERHTEKPEERAKKIMEAGKMEISSTDVRNAMGMQTRSTLIATDSLVEPTKNGNDIKDNLNPVSSIIDQVSVIDATGAAAFEEAYVKSEPTAAERKDGSTGTATDPVFRVAKLKPELINVTSFVSKNIQRVSPLAYEAKIRSLALKALRRKVANMIVNGSTDAFGIKTAKNTMNEDICKELLLNANTIDANTLKKIVFSYGGNDELGGNARLFLTKEDLQKFGEVRGTNEKKALYEITPDNANPNIGTIKEGGLIVPYTINSSLTSLSSAVKGTEKVQTMIYGDPANFELALFGNYTVEVFKETKAVEGMITIIGEIMAGGNVIADGGFVVVTLASN